MRRTSGGCWGRQAKIDFALNMQQNTCPFGRFRATRIQDSCGSNDGLRIGMKVVGRHNDETRLIRLAAAFGAQP